MADLYAKDFWQMGSVEAPRRAELVKRLGGTGMSFMLNSYGERGVRYSTAPQTREAFVQAIRACRDHGLTATATVWLSGEVEDQVRGWADEMMSLPDPPDFLEMDLEGEFKARARGDGSEFAGWLDRYWGPTGLPCAVTTFGVPPAKTIPAAKWCAKHGGGVRPQAYSVVTSKGHGRTELERAGVLQPHSVREWSKHVPTDAIWMGLDVYGDEPFGADTAQAMAAQIDTTIQAGVKRVVFWSLEHLERDTREAQVRRSVIASYDAAPPLLQRVGLGRFVPGGASPVKAALGAAGVIGGAALLRRWGGV